MSKDIAQIHKLKEDILAGNTTYSDVERRLSAAIEAEYDREDANIDFINACEDLLLEMHTDGELPSFPTSEEYAIEMQKHMLVKKERSFLPKFAWRCAAVLAAMLVIVLLGDQVFHWQWFSGTSTEDEQQYVVQGYDIDIATIQSSIVAHEETIQLQTMLWDEVVSFLGFEPVAPDRKMLNAKEQTYFAFIHPESISFSAQYVVGEEIPTYVLYSAQYYSHMDEAYTLLEQTTEGIHETIYNTDVYFSNNFDQSLFAWTNGTATYQLMGSIDYESGIEIIRDMLGGKPHE